MEWRAEYKCRLCGKTFTSVATGLCRTALQCTWYFCGIGVKRVPLQPELLEPHECEDGSFGIADFQGMRKVE